MAFGKFVDQYLSLVRRFIPKTKMVSSVGLDIGKKTCKLVEVVKSGNSFQILNWAVEPIKDNNPSDTIANLLSRLNISSKSPYTAVSGKGTLIRYIDVPRMNQEDLRKSFQFEADKYFPFAQEQMYTDCYILDPEGKGKKMSVLAAAVKKELIDARLTLLSNLNLQSPYIGVNAVAVANLWHVLGSSQGNNKSSAKESTPSAIAVLDMGFSGSNLVIMRDTLPFFTRDILIGGEEFDKRISNMLGLSLPEAEKLKCDPKEKLSEVLNACDSLITNLISEIRLSFDYFITERNIPITKLFLTGGVSQWQGLGDIIGKQLDLPVVSWDPVSFFKLADTVNQEEITKQTNQLGVALGLSLYEYD